MAGLPIAVEITPPDAPREHVMVLLAACGRASADAECLPAADVTASGSRAVAIVTWQGERRAVIEVGLRKEGRPVWRNRSIDFQTQDDLIERWRAIGFVVGTLSRPEVEVPDSEVNPAPEPRSKPDIAEPALKKESQPEPQAKITPEPVREERSINRSPRLGERPRRIASERPSRAVLDLGGVVGPGLEGVRSGAVARARLRLFEPLTAVFAVRYLDRPVGDGSFGGRWITTAAGVGSVLGADDLQLAASVDARAEFFHGRAEDGDRQDSAGRWISGLGLGLNGGWMPSRALGFFLGADGAWMFGTTELRIGDESVATDSSLRFAVEGGVRLRLW